MQKNDRDEIEGHEQDGNYADAGDRPYQARGRHNWRNSSHD